MIQLVFVFGVVLPTLVTVACFIGFLICWFRFRSLRKRQHATDRKSCGATCPRRCRVYAASSSTPDIAPTCRCGTGCSIPTGNSIPVGWVTHVIDQRRDNVVLPLTADAASVIDVPSTATAELGRFGTSASFRPISGSRSTTMLPCLLLSHPRRPRTSVSDELMRARTTRAGEFPPGTFISGLEPRKKGGGPSSRAAAAVDACYVDVEPIIHATKSPSTGHKRPRMSASSSVDDAAVFKPVRHLATASGLSGDRKYYWSSRDGARMLRTAEEVRLPSRVKRHHSLAEVPRHHRELQIKTAADQTSLDF